MILELYENDEQKNCCIIKMKHRKSYYNKIVETLINNIVNNLRINLI